MSEAQEDGSHYQHLTGAAGHKKISELIKGIHIAMMTTVAKDGTMSSRPMAVQNTEFDGTLWFLTRRDSEKVDEVEEHANVTLTFAEPKNSKYITLKGTSAVSQDRAKIQQLWNPMYRAWFPGGEADPQIAVMRVDVNQGDFWEASDSKLVMLVRYAAASITKGKIPVGESGHIEA